MVAVDVEQTLKQCLAKIILIPYSAPYNCLYLNQQCMSYCFVLNCRINIDYTTNGF